MATTSLLSSMGVPLLASRGYRAVEQLRGGSYGTMYVVQDMNVHISSPRHAAASSNNGFKGCQLPSGGATGVLAAKVLPRKRHDLPQYANMDMIRSEIKGLEKVRGACPNVLQLHGVVEDDDHVCLLTDLLLPGGAAPKPEGAATVGLHCLAVDLVRGVAACHAAGLMHGDIKPDNVVLDCEGGRGWVLIDFGSSVECTGHTEGVYRLRLLTPRYAAPEVLRYRPGTDVGFAADMYSIGATLIELRERRPPAIAREPMRVTVLDWAIDEMLHRRPESRPTAQQVLQWLLESDPVREARDKPVALEV